MGKDLDIYTGPGNELEVAPEVIDAEIVAEVVHVANGDAYAGLTGAYVELSENNSGGSWWLSDEDWLALEAKGWVIEWAEIMREQDFHRQYPSSIVLGEDGKYRYMGARAKEARRYGVSMNVARAEFQDATGQDPDEEGCDCCGQPHYFSARDAEGNYSW